MSEDPVAFLNARLDERLDWHVLDCSGMPRGENMDQPCCEAQARVPREVAAKRAILDLYEEEDGCHTPDYYFGLWQAIVALAAVYSGQPG